MGNVKVKDRYVLFATIIFIFVFPSLVFRGNRTADSNKNAINDLKKTNPDYVFIGNSMLETRIDPEHLSKLLDGKKVSLLIGGGDLSALWFLRLKNQLIASGIKPQKVFIFFRDEMLTAPKERTQGIYQKRIKDLSFGEEPVVEQVLYANMNAMDKISSKIDTIYPIRLQQSNIETYINWIAILPVYPNIFINKVKYRYFSLINKNVAISDLQAAEEEKLAFQERVNSVFALRNMRSIELSDLTPDATKHRYDFAHNITNSFLPHIIELARSNGLDLVFIRVQRRPTISAPHTHEDPQLIQYINDLEKYLKANNCAFYDFTGDPVISLSIYADGDHISYKHRAFYTEHFAERLSEEFK